MYDLTGFQRDLLYTIVGQDDPHGLAIKDELGEYQEKEIHHGRLYPNLDTLVEKGLVEKGELDRRTNYYTVTRRGQREIDARRDWEEQYLDHSDEQYFGTLSGGYLRRVRRSDLDNVRLLAN